jgi:hypothetical protein
MGARTGAPDVLVRVTVESNVLVAGFRTGSGRVIANWPVMSFVTARAAGAGTTAHCPVRRLRFVAATAIEAFLLARQIFSDRVKEHLRRPALSWTSRLPLTALATTAVAAELFVHLEIAADRIAGA